jgi:uncharacterized protein (TIGR02996 family)
VIAGELHAALRGGDEPLLMALLRAWAHYRSPGLAQAVAALTRRLARRLVPIEDAQTWHQVAACRDPRTVAALLAAPWRRDRPSLLRRKLLALQAFPPDPRLAAFGEEVLAHFPSVRPGSDKTREAAGRLLALHGPMPLGPLHGDPAPDPAIEELAARVCAQPDLEASLLAAVVASPDEDGPRMVYADFLSERGDPLGESMMRMIREPVGFFPFLTLGLGVEQRERWCRMLMGGGVDPETVQFRRGFPYAVHVDGLRPLPVPGPGWGTIEMICLSHPQGSALGWLESLAGLPNLRVLDLITLAEASDWLILALPKLAALRLRSVGISSEMWRPEHGRQVFWPALQRLGLCADGEIGLDEARLGELALRPLEVLVYSRRSLAYAVEAAVRAMPTAGEGISRVVASDSWLAEPFPLDRLALSVERAQGTLLHARVLKLGWHNVDQLARALRRVEPRSFASLTIESEAHADRKFQARVGRALARFRGSPVLFAEPAR